MLAYALGFGPSFFQQAPPKGITPYYLELWDWRPLNFGGGCGQVDLESGIFDWACG